MYIPQLLGMIVYYVSFLFAFYAGNALSVIGGVDLVDATYQIIHHSMPHMKRMYNVSYERVASMAKFTIGKVKSFSRWK